MRRFALLFCLAIPALAWNATGHRIVAAIAYERLTPEARDRVDDLIKRHPDYNTLFTVGAPADPAGRARAAFIAASVWADQIKGDNRFYDDTRQDSKPTPTLPGFPDMARHTNWHYIDLPISGDGTQGKVEPPPTALTELARILRGIEVYDLPWLIHIEGDVHQPLHCVSRFLKALPKGDQGGNLVFVNPGRNLHAVWDDAAGNDTSDAYVTTFAHEVVKEYTAAHGVNPHLSKNPKKWIEEGARLARREVYTFGTETGSRDLPVPLPPGYAANAAKVARIQLAKAGFRLASVLNERLK